MFKMYPISKTISHILFVFFFFFNDTATTEIYTLSLHDALPISQAPQHVDLAHRIRRPQPPGRSEEHTSELQSRENLVCSLLLEKKKKNSYYSFIFKEINNNTIILYTKYA